MYSFLVFQTTFLFELIKNHWIINFLFNNHSWWHINNLSDIVEQLHVENGAISAIIMIVIRECDYYT